MADVTYLVEGNFQIHTEKGLVPYSKALADSSTEVLTKRGPVNIYALLPEDVVTLEVKAGSLPGLIFRHG